MEVDEEMGRIAVDGKRVCVSTSVLEIFERRKVVAAVR